MERLFMMGYVRKLLIDHDYKREHELDHKESYKRNQRAQNKGLEAFYKYRRGVASYYTSKKEVRDYVFKKYNYTCANCGSKENLQIDHIISVRSCGLNKISNLQVLCRSCNCAKTP